MEERVVTVVTGGSRGIGAAVCARLATEGHDIVLGYRSDGSAAESVAQSVRQAGRRCVTVRADTADEADVDRLFDRAAGLGPVTGLVNNAGTSGPNGRLTDADAAGIRRALDVNVLGYLLCARRAIQEMAGSGGGAIVNISSAAATLGSPGQYVHYAAAKAAVDAMTVGLSKEVAAQGIRVNCVAPGTIWTDFHQDPERPRKVASAIPLGRAGQPEEIAAAVSWLLSADASYATGAILRVAGGL
ncbi:SDR family NAD(P)-dependent oxidoreductase [Streptomyces sp. NPDC052396]|uniref:SDR family NAD(P)-dependent oxidoreductase n=1 Tax=Streptomyces sp. NPDC052396 TaxID=3365689 RepID=UPI0037D98AB7